MPVHEHRPIAAGELFPATRLGVFLGLAFAAGGIFIVEVGKQTAEERAPAFIAPGGFGGADARPTSTSSTPAAADPNDAQVLPREPRTLLGPMGVELPVPVHGPVILHVWLEGCSDCMSAFEAHKRRVELSATKDGSFGDMPQFNVAYGTVTTDFARKYRVDHNLVIDTDGTAIVRPFGIGSFTTLVIDRQGNARARARPDEPRYFTIIRDAYAAASADLGETGAPSPVLDP